MIEDKLIKQEILFGNPEKLLVKISPDGTYISYIAPYKGVLNILIAPIGNLSNIKFITTNKNRGIRNYFWSKNGDYIIYIQDQDGDENWQLCSVNINTLKEQVLTPSNGVRASILKLSDKFPKEILVYLNNRLPEYFDIYRANVETGKLELVYENNENYSSFVADSNFNIRLGYKMLSNGEGNIFLFKNGDVKIKKLLQTIPVEDMINTTTLHISKDNRTLFMLDSINRNTSALVEIDLISMQKKVLYQSCKADIDDYIIDIKTEIVQGAAINYTRKTWVVLDDSIKNDMNYLTACEDGDLEIISKNSNDTTWIVAYLKSDAPTKYWIYNKLDRRASFLFSSNNFLNKEPLSKMHPVIIRARDGLDLVCYVTVPRWLDNGKGLPAHPIPTVLNVHGGPNARDSWGYRADVQWLANRGYACINVNYRGSTGFGKNFVNAGDGEWAKKMQDDLEDAVSWAVENKIAMKDKIAIMGGSYGGYATLVGMSMTPDLYVAGIDIVGPSNLETLLLSIPKYWKPHIAHLTKIIGASYKTEEGRKLLRSRSPLTYAKNIKKPLLIIQGANDPRVKQSESDQIVESMKNSSIPVVYLLYPDEGHGLARPENKLSMYANAEIFLANFAGGRYMSHNNKFPGSSIIIKEGKSINWTKTKQDNMR